MRILYALFFFVLAFNLPVFCQQITVLFTGTSYSTLYPVKGGEILGGISRRTTLIKQEKGRYENTLIVDSGNLFARPDLGRLSQDLARQKTQIALKAVQIIGYDAVGIGIGELGFGIDYLQENIRNHSSDFISCNTDLGAVTTSVVKQKGSLRIGITGVSNPDFSNYGVFILNYIEELKKVFEDFDRQRADVVILLSSLKPEDLYFLIDTFPQIDIVISSNLAQSPEPAEKIKDTLIMYPSFKAKYLGKIVINNIDNGVIKDYKAEYIPVSESIEPDPSIQKLLPACFSDNDCPFKEGFLSVCSNPGAESRCLYKGIEPVPVKVITDKGCQPCSTQITENILNQHFDRIRIEKLDYQSKEAKRLIEKFNIKTLPAFLVNKSIQEQDNFLLIKDSFSKSGQYYIMMPELSGIFYYLDRPYVEDTVDLFIDPFGKGPDSTETAVNLKSVCEKMGLQLAVHFVSEPENEYYRDEILRFIAVRQLYPERFLDYFIDRVNNINSSFWNISAQELGMDTRKITRFSLSGKVENILDKDIKLSDNLQIVDTPAILVNNQKIFSFTGKGVFSEEMFEEFKNE